jgi:hypothetical protein
MYVISLYHVQEFKGGITDVRDVGSEALGCAQGAIKYIVS